MIVSPTKAPGGSSLFRHNENVISMLERGTAIEIVFEPELRDPELQRKWKAISARGWKVVAVELQKLTYGTSSLRTKTIEISSRPEEGEKGVTFVHEVTHAYADSVAFDREEEFPNQDFLTYLEQIRIVHPQVITYFGADLPPSATLHEWQTLIKEAPVRLGFHNTILFWLQDLHPTLVPSRDLNTTNFWKKYLEIGRAKQKEFVDGHIWSVVSEINCFKEQLRIYRRLRLEDSVRLAWDTLETELWARQENPSEEMIRFIYLGNHMSEMAVRLLWDTPLFGKNKENTPGTSQVNSDSPG